MEEHKFQPRKKLLEGYRKARLVNSAGETILPRTTASMVSEEPDRRFLNNEEKSMIFEMSANKDGYLTLVKHSTELMSLANREQDIIKVIDSTTALDIADINEKMEKVEAILTYKDELLEIAKNDIFALSPTTQSRYFITVDDTDLDNPKLKIEIDDTRVTEPMNYKKGDEWEVPQGAKDVKVSIPFAKIVQAKDKEVVMSLVDIDSGADISQPMKDNIIAGSALTTEAKGALAIGQSSISFNVVEYLEEAFGVEGIFELITKFNLKVLMRPDETGNVSRAQMFRDKGLVAPIRVTMDKSNFDTAEFTNITWSVTHDDKWLNGNGVATVLVYGGRGHGTSIANPSLVVELSHPYKGKTLVADKDMDKEFNILDWRVKE